MFFYLFKEFFWIRGKFGDLSHRTQTEKKQQEDDDDKITTRNKELLKGQYQTNTSFKDVSDDLLDTVIDIS